MLPQTADFNLGEYTGIGLDTRQLYFLAGVLFFGIFAILAVKRVSQTGGLWAAVWGSVAVCLIAVGIHLAGTGLADFVPEWLKPFTEKQLLQRSATLGVIACWSFFFLSAHWVNDALGKWIYRVIGVSLAGYGVWLAIGWFRDVLPEEALPYATLNIVVRAGVAISLLLLAGGLWVKGKHSGQHWTWLYRSFIPLVLGGLALLIYDQIGSLIPIEWQFPQTRAWIIQAIRIWTVAFLLICGVAWLAREKPIKESTQVSNPRPSIYADPPRKEVPPAQLPVAILLDDQGRPVLPPGKRV